MNLNFRAIDGKAPCNRRKKGFMKILSAVSDNRFIMECNFCGEKDDLEFKEDNGIKIIMRKRL